MILRLLLLQILVLFACSDPKPTPSQMEKNFTLHQEIFEEVADFACTILKKQNSSISEKNGYAYSIGDSNEDRFKEFDSLLKKIGSTGVTYYPRKDGNCSLTVSYYARGFATTSLVFYYSYQKENLNLVPKTQQSIDVIIESKERQIVDMPLTNEWYITFKYA